MQTSTVGTWGWDPSTCVNSQTHSSETVPTPQSRNKILHTGKMLEQPEQQSGPETLKGTSAAGDFSHHKHDDHGSQTSSRENAAAPGGHAGGGAQESRLLCKVPAGARSAPGPGRSGWKGRALTRSSPALVQCLPVPHSVPSGHLWTARMRHRHPQPWAVSSPAIASTAPQTEPRAKPAGTAPTPRWNTGRPRPALRPPPTRFAPGRPHGGQRLPRPSEGRARAPGAPRPPLGRARPFPRPRASARPPSQPFPPHFAPHPPSAAAPARCRRTGLACCALRCQRRGSAQAPRAPALPGHARHFPLLAAAPPPRFRLRTAR